MRLFRNITSLAIATLVALVYVHQQVELVKLSYTIEHKEHKLEYMLDHKDILAYNIDNLEAPSRLEKALISQKIDITFPKRGQIVKTPSGTKSVSVRKAAIEKKVSRFGIFEFFGFGREAHAKER